MYPNEQILTERRQELVAGLHIKGISDENVLIAINSVLRHKFIARNIIDRAYHDIPLPIHSGQTISQPFTVAYQTELLEIKPNDKVLEIGTGSGYQCAVLLQMGAKVWSLERKLDLYKSVSKFLPSIGYNANLFYSDGFEGLAKFAPFNKILITAAAPYLPKQLINQLEIGGILVAPVNNGINQSMLKVVKKSETELEKSTHGEFRFVPMLNGVD